MKYTFGQFLRGARTGFFYSEKHKVFIRITGIGKLESSFEIELCPDKIMNVTDGRAGFVRYMAWNENEEGIEAVESLNLPRRIKNYITINVNKRGQII